MNSLKSLKLLIESLQVRFLRIRLFELDYNWYGAGRHLAHTVLWFIYEGALTLEVNGKRLPRKLNAGELIVLPGGSNISFRAVSDRIKLASINMDAQVTLIPGRSWTDVLRIPYHFAGISAELQPLLQTMLSAGKASPVAPQLLQQAALLELLHLLLSRSLENPAPDPLPGEMPRGGDARLHKIIGYLTANPREAPGVKELAALAELSESHLRRLFVDHTGLPPGRFVQQLKLEQAKTQLMNGDRRISDIAFGLGFQDANYFSRLFRERYSCTPLQYRQRHRFFEP